MEMEEAKLVHAQALTVVGSPEQAAAESFPSHLEDTPMTLGTLPKRYCFPFFLLVNEVGDICRCLYTISFEIRSTMINCKRRELKWTVDEDNALYFA
jgi:hypothetical protein